MPPLIIQGSGIIWNRLQVSVESLQVSDLIEFIDSPTEAEKFVLYRQCDSVLYTPPNEHFGIRQSSKVLQVPSHFLESQTHQLENCFKKYPMMFLWSSNFIDPPWLF
uniref:Uncharacterized protein n=1 Tax=Parascaris equorum TaxID=6256 RepID=A0A914S9Y0_PAREQ